MIHSSQPARLLLINLLMHAICYTRLIFTMLSCSFLLSKFKYRNKDSFFKFLLLLSGDINQTLWPSHINQTSGNNEWDVFKDRGFYLIPIYIISLLPKIEEIRRIACLSNAAVN